MNIKQQALLKTVYFFVTAIVAACVAMLLVMHVPAHVLIFFALGLFLLWMGIIYYEITKSQLEYKQKLKEMVDQK